MEITSLILNRTFNNAGIRAQSPPAKNPAINISKIVIHDGIDGPICNAIHVAPAEPKTSWPSAPIFQNFARKTRVSPAAIRISGIALVIVSLIPYRLPNDPEKIFAMA